MMWHSKYSPTWYGSNNLFNPLDTLTMRTKLKQILNVRDQIDIIKILNIKLKYGIKNRGPIL